MTGVLLMESMATSAGVDDNIIARPIFWQVRVDCCGWELLLFWVGGVGHGWRPGQGAEGRGGGVRK